MFLCYGEPAVMNYFGWENEALGISNAEIGAKIFAGIDCELIQMSARRLWSAGSNGEPGFLQALAGLYIQFEKGREKGEKYVRDLDLDSASAMVTYKKDKVIYTRHYFASSKRSCLVGRLSCEGGEKAAFSAQAYLKSEQGGEAAAFGTELVLSGGEGGARYSLRVRFICDSESIEAQDDKLIIKGAKSLVFIACVCVGGDADELSERTAEQCLSAQQLSFAQLYKEHVDEYRSQFNKTGFSLCQPEVSHPTDYMLKRFGKKKEHKRTLITLMFDYAKYLLLCSADRRLPLCADSGIWAARSGECGLTVDLYFTFKILLSVRCGLYDCTDGYIDFLRAMSEKGLFRERVDPLFSNAPSHEPSLGAPVSAALMCAALYERYRYERDEAFLSRLYPLLERYCELYLEGLSDVNGGLVLLEGPKQGLHTAFGQTAVYALFRAYLSAADALCSRSPLYERVREAAKGLTMPQTAKGGEIAEYLWQDSLSRSEKKRLQKQKQQLLHLSGVYPFEGIITDHAAAQKTLRGAKQLSTEATAHCLMCHASLGNGEECDRVVEQYLKSAVRKNLLSARDGCALYDSFGFALGIMQMLIGSSEDCIRLLPALPGSWSDGSFSALPAVGGFLVSLEWKNGRIKGGSVTSTKGGKCSLLADGHILIVTDKDGSELPVEFENGVTSFETQAGGKYSFV